MNNKEESNKKFLPLWILKILYQYSDEYNPLTQEDIIKKLNDDYGIIAERKAIGRNIERLVAAGYDIVFVKGKGNYINRDFTDGELRFLIDNVIASKFIRSDVVERLVSRIVSLGTPTFNKQIESLDYSKRQCSIDDNILCWVDLIAAAISENKQISFRCNKHSVFTAQQPIDPIIVTPLNLMIDDGKYFLIGFVKASNRTDMFRLDKLSDLKMLDEKGEAGSEISNDCDVNSYDVELMLDKNLFDDAFDIFGNEIHGYRATGREVYIKLKADELKIIKFAIINEARVKILSPESLRLKMRDIGKSILDHYQNDDEYANCIDEALNTEELNMFQVKLKGRIEKEKLDKLQAAYFFCNDLTDIEFIKNYKELKSLAIVENPINDISSIKELPCLKRLQIEGCAMLEDYSAIYELPDLSELILDEQATQKIDLEKVKAINPTLNVRNIDIENLRKKKEPIDSYTYNDSYPYNVIKRLFGYWHTICGDKGAIEKTLNQLKDSLLTQEECDVFHWLYEVQASYDAIARQFGKLPTAIKNVEAAIIAKLRHPSSSKKLAEFIAFEEQ